MSAPHAEGVFRAARSRPFASAGRPAGPVAPAEPDRAQVSKAAIMAEKAARVAEDRASRTNAARLRRERLKEQREQFFVQHLLPSLVAKQTREASPRSSQKRPT